MHCGETKQKGRSFTRRNISSRVEIKMGRGAFFVVDLEFFGGEGDLELQVSFNLTYSM